MSTNPFGPPVTSSCPTWVGRVYLAGDYDEIRAAVRRFCSGEGACFSVTPATYIYSGGEEAGATVTLINYPRFPKPAPDLERTINRLAQMLMAECHQSSLCVETPSETVWTSRRRDT